MKAAVALLVLTGIASAEPRKPITLAEALAALPGAPQAAVPKAEVEAAEATAQAALAWPTAPVVKIAGTRLTAKAIGGIAVPLPLFGTLRATRRHARADATVAHAQAQIDLRTLRHRVIRAWIELARADAALVTSSLAAQHAAELEVIARGRKEAGVGAEVDIMTAGAAKARADVDAVSAERTLDAASAELAGLLGWDPAQPLHAEGGLDTGHPPALESLRAKILSHPEHVLAEDRVRAAATNVDQVRAERWPKIALESEVQYDDKTVEGPTPWSRTDVIVGVLVEVPLFSRIGDRTRAARAQENVARLRLSATERELDAGLYSTYRKWQAAVQRLEALERDVLPTQERAAALSAQAFREGARDLTSAIQAQRDLDAVHTEVNTARADAAVAFADLQLAAGMEVGHAP
jgi:outer membrane protein TolC